MLQALDSRHFQQELKALDSFLASGNPKNSFNVTWQRNDIKPRDDIRRIVNSRNRAHEAGHQQVSNVAEGYLTEISLRLFFLMALWELGFVFRFRGLGVARVKLKRRGPRTVRCGSEYGPS